MVHRDAVEFQKRHRGFDAQHCYGSVKAYGKVPRSYISLIQVVNENNTRDLGLVKAMLCDLKPSG